MIQYAGINLLQPPAELAAWIEANVSPSDIRLFNRPQQMGPGLSHLDTLPDWPHRPVRLNSLWFPNGASRWATFFGLVDEPMLAAIRDQVYTGADGYQVQTLVLDDGSGAGPVSTSLWMLPPRPLSQIGSDGFSLLTLVDERYFWWFKAASFIVTGSTTWTSLYADIATALGITLTVDAIPAAYLFPSPLLAHQYRAVPPLLDAVAYSVGQRFLRDLDGTCRCWSVSAARTREVLLQGSSPDREAGGVITLGA